MKTFYEEFSGESQENLDDAFIWACLQGQLDKIKYLLTSPELKIHADIHTEGDNGLMLAFRKNHFDIIKYLLTSKDLKDHANIYNNNCQPFERACLHSNQEVLEYLVLDYKIEKTKEIQDYLLKYPKDVVNKLFQTRELEEQLEPNSSTNKTRINKL